MKTNNLARAFPTALFVLMVLAPVGAAAQAVSDSFEELSRQTVKEFWRSEQPLLKEGDTIWITYMPNGETEHLEKEAKVVGLTESAIIMMLEGAQIEVPESRVRRIEWRRKDSLLDGAGIGAAAGAGVGLLMGASVCQGGLFGADCESGSIYAVFGGVGGAIGAGLGALADRTKKAPPLLVYLSQDPSNSSFTLSVAPIISKDRKGVLFSVTW